MSENRKELQFIFMMQVVSTRLAKYIVDIRQIT